MDDNNAADPFESGNPLKKKNFDKSWLGFLLIALVLVVAIGMAFWMFLRRY